jgi:hypothetical protein
MRNSFPRLALFLLKADCVHTGDEITLDDIDWGKLRPLAKFAAFNLEHVGVQFFWEALEIPRIIGTKGFLKQFFIRLGECLSDKTKRELVVKQDVDIAEILLCGLSEKRTSGTGKARSEIQEP